MKKAGWILLLVVLTAFVLSVGAFASGEPSGEPASAEPAAAAETNLQADTGRFAVKLVVNGKDYRTASVGASARGNVYTFEIGELLDVLGAVLAYNENTGEASLRAKPDGLMAVLVGRITGMLPDGDPEPTTGRITPWDLMAQRHPASKNDGESTEVGRITPQELMHRRIIGRGNS